MIYTFQNWLTLRATHCCIQGWTWRPVGFPHVPPRHSSPSFPFSRAKTFIPSPLLYLHSVLSQLCPCCFCGYHRESEGSILTFDVAQNWISTVILSPSASWSVIHAVTNWVTCQQPESVNGWLLVICVCDLFFFFFFFPKAGELIRQKTEITHTTSKSKAEALVLNSPTQRHILCFVSVILCRCLLNVTLHCFLAACDIYN